MRLAVGVGVMLGASAAWAAPAGVVGNWATSDGSVVRVAPCGSEICLTVVKVTPTAPTTTDAQNPDAHLRSRPLCGLRIGFGFKAEGENAASGGRLYDPKSGRTYSGKIELKGDRLHLRGYVGVALFGRSEVWTRAGEVGACRG
jgi:uncharacterized protein (DUF2147 family)